MRLFFAFIFAACLSGASAQAAESGAVREYKNSMKQMMGEMHIAYSGQVDSDFARGMIPHHRAAIRMARTVLAHGGKDDNIRSLATWIIAAQEAEIGIMQRWLNRRGKAEPAKTTADVAARPYARQSDVDMQIMHRDMNIVYSGDALHDFVCGMIPHHQGAIDMAFVELSYGSKPEMQALAKNIIRSQKGDIARMQHWLREKNLSCRVKASHHHAHH